MANYIGIDVGTTTITGLLLDSDQGRILHLDRRRNDAALGRTLPGRAEQNPLHLRSTVLEALKELADWHYPVDGIALTGQKHGLLCLDAGARPLTPLISWQDRRTAEPLADGLSTLDQIYARLQGHFWLENGCRVQHGYGAATLFWLSQGNRMPQGADRVSSIADWLAGQLCGKLPQTDPTFAASWGIYNVVGGDWNQAQLDILGLDPALLPPVRPSGEHLGGLCSTAAQAVGLPEGTPVFNAFGDTQASFLGSIGRPEDALLCNLGTGGQVCWMVPHFAPPGGAVETRPLPDGRFLRVGASLCGGAAYAWLNRTVRAWLEVFDLQLTEAAVYDRLNAAAMACRESEGLAVRPTFLGTRAAHSGPAVQAGAIEGITPDNMRLGPLARATLAGVVDELYRLFQARADEVPGLEKIVAAGGAVWKNPLLPQLIADRFGLPVQVPIQTETAALGAAAFISRAELVSKYGSLILPTSAGDGL
jgi:sedoheptulokinase